MEGGVIESPNVLIYNEDVDLHGLRGMTTKIYIRSNQSKTRQIKEMSRIVIAKKKSFIIDLITSETLYIMFGSNLSI